MQVERLAAACRGSCGTQGPIDVMETFFLYSAKVSCKNIIDIKLEVIRMGMYFIHNMAKQTKRKIIVDIIRK